MFFLQKVLLYAGQCIDTKMRENHFAFLNNTGIDANDFNWGNEFGIWQPSWFVVHFS